MAAKKYADDYENVIMTDEKGKNAGKPSTGVNIMRWLWMPGKSKLSEIRALL